MITEKKNNLHLKLDIFNNAPIGIISVRGLQLILEYANNYAISVLGLKTPLLGSALVDIIPELISQSLLDDIRNRCFDKGESIQLLQTEIIRQKGNHQRRAFDVTIQPVNDEHESVTRVVFFLTEVSDRLITQKSSRDREVLQQLIDSSVELIAVIDPDLNFMVVNAAFERFVKKTRAQLVGKQIFEAYQGARGSEQVALLKKALAGERIHVQANPSISRPQEFWFDTHFVPLIIDEKIEGVIVLSRDISAIVKSEHALVKANRQLEEAQRLSKIGSWEWDVTKGSVIWSDEMYRIYGYEEKFPVDFNKATERMSAEDAERSSKRTQQHIQKAIENYRRTGDLVFEIPSVEFSVELPGGERKLLRSSGKLELTPEGNLHRIVGAIQDITEIREAEKRLRSLVSELELKNMDLESFNYVASHDLQEPLRKIRTYIDRVRNSNLSREAMDDYLTSIDTSAKRMNDLIQSILEFSRLSRHEDELTAVDLNEVLNYCRSEFELAIVEKEAVVDAENLPVIRASEFQMRQLFYNLMSNAFKFSNGRPLITIRCQREGRVNVFADNSPMRDYWCISFSDNGIGFDPQYKEKIFELFQRLHPKQEFSGTGIGLSIVKRIVDRHEGFVEAISRPGEGATFKIFLPCSNAA